MASDDSGASAKINWLMELVALIPNSISDVCSIPVSLNAVFN